jgi:hypothetical protein
MTRWGIEPQTSSTMVPYHWATGCDRTLVTVKVKGKGCDENLKSGEGYRQVRGSGGGGKRAAGVRRMRGMDKGCRGIWAYTMQLIISPVCSLYDLNEAVTHSECETVFAKTSASRQSITVFLWRQMWLLTMGRNLVGWHWTCVFNGPVRIARVTNKGRG